MLSEEIKRLAMDMHGQVVANRRHLHAHPELSFKEFNTSAFIKQALTSAGILWQPAGDTGIIARIEGSEPNSKTIVLRADIDALPIIEHTGVAYASTSQGVMHACGHDAHTACMLGAAAILQKIKHRLTGTAKIIFQPAEEKMPGGAVGMIHHGVLNPMPQAVVGQHVAPFIKSGYVGIRAGSFMASMDEIYITIHGKGGHGAQPHLNIDPVLIASHMIVALQQVVSRNANPTTPSVLSFGKVIANGAVNIIPDQVYIEGTFRTVNEAWRDEAHEKIKTIAQGIVASMGGTCDINIIKGYPSLVNNEAVTERVTAAIEEYIGKDKIVHTGIWMAAEDFAYYAQQAPSCFYLLGTNHDETTANSLHTPNFNLDEDALITGTGLLAFVAARELEAVKA